MGIKAIPTHYNGYYFRSRLEARWAVFFDTASIKYEYEPEGFTNEGKSYLPDFYLPEYDIYVEVKPNADKFSEDFDKIYACMKDNATPISKGLLLLGQIPYYDMDKLNEDGENEFTPIFSFLFWAGELLECDAIFTFPKKHNVSLNIFKIDSFTVADKRELYLPDDMYSLSLTWSFELNNISYIAELSDAYESAIRMKPIYEAARSARFEFKEKK